MDDVTATLRGVTIGAGTNYRWATWPRGLGTPPIRANDLERPGRHGVVAGDDLYGARTITFEIVVRAANRADGERRGRELAAAFARSNVDLPLGLRIAGDPAEYTLYGRPRGCDLAMSRRFLGGYSEARCSFVATDPIMYGPITTIDIGLTPSGGGLVFPATFPVVFSGSGNSGLGAFDHVGAADVDRWVATITGPVTNPRLEHIESGRFLRFIGTLAASESLVVDGHTRSVMLGGTASRANWIAAGSRWFEFTPGSNSIRFTADTGSGATSIDVAPGWD